MQLQHSQAEVMLGSVPLSVPVLLPVEGTDEDADLLSGVAMSGAVGLISSGMIHRDPATYFWNGKVSCSPMMARLVRHYRRYDRGMGQLVVQVDRSDDRLGVPEYVISNLGVTALEFVFRSAPGGFPQVHRLDSLATALRRKKSGNLVLPDPDLPSVQEHWKSGDGQYFRMIQQDSYWEPEILEQRFKDLKALGLQHIYLRAEEEAEQDLKFIQTLAVKLGAELVSLNRPVPRSIETCHESFIVDNQESLAHLRTLCPKTIQNIKLLKPYADADAYLEKLHTIYGKDLYISRGCAACYAMIQQISRMGVNDRSDGR